MPPTEHELLHPTDLESLSVDEADFERLEGTTACVGIDVLFAQHWDYNLPTVPPQA